MPADHILNVFKARVVKDAGPTMAITFNRSKKAIRELCRIYKNSSAKLSRQPVVYFVSKTGEDEEYEEEAAEACRWTNERVSFTCYRNGALL